MDTQLPNHSIALKCSLFILLLFCSVFKSHAAVGNYGFNALTGVALEDSASTTQLIAINQDNTASAVTAIGFTFVFDGVSYTQFSVNSNGLMRLGATAVTNTATNSLATATDNPKIAPYWDDLRTVGGTVRYKLIGTAPNRKLIVQWTVTIVAPNTSNARFQVWLFESTNTVQFVYNTNLVTNTGNYSVGLATSATDYLSVSTGSGTVSSTTVNNSNTSPIASGTSYRFTTPPGCVTGITPANASTGMPLQNTLSWTAGTGTTTGYDVYFGTSSNPPLVSYNQAATSYATAILNWNTTYYWKVVARNDSAQALSCAVNSFTTGSPLSYDVTRSTGIAYNSIVSTGSSAPSWRNSLSTDDNLSNSIPIGFNFAYNGSTYSSFLVSTNGFITFNTTTASNGGAPPYSYVNSAVYSGTAPTSPLLIAPFYEDMVLQGNPGTMAGLDGGIKYLTTGTTGNRVLTVEWIGMENWQTGGPNLNFQVKLYENGGAIEFIYGVMEGFGFNGTVNLNYSYNIGINGKAISTTPQIGEVLNQQLANTRSFGIAGNQLNGIPECNSMLRFVPGTYTPYVPPASLAPVNDSLSTKITVPVYPAPCVELCGTYYTSANATRSISGAGTSCANADDDVWFEFIATNSNTQIKVVGAGNYDAVVELMNTSYGLISCANSSGMGLGQAETITVTSLVVGQTYFIRVYEKNSGWGTNSSGQFYLCVSGTPVAPSNDECANSININVTGLPAVFTAGTSTYSATASPGVPVCSVSGTTPDDDVWYKFTAANTTEIITVNSNTGFNGVIQLFSGTCASLTSIGCVNSVGNGQQEVLTANNLVRNQVYYFRVYHALAGAGTGSYNLSVSSPPPGCTQTMLPPNGEINLPSSNLHLEWEKVTGADNYKVMLDTVNPPQKQLVLTTDSFAVANDLINGKTYYWSVNSGNATGFNNSCVIFNFTTETRPYLMEFRVLIESLYKGNGKMHAYANASAGIADTILVDFIDEDSIVYFSERLLLDTNGHAEVYLPEGMLGLSFYYVVSSQNSLETWSNFVLFDTLNAIYDFTLDSTQAYGNNLLMVGVDEFAIYSGDLNQDDAINVLDLDFWKTQGSLFKTGYNVGDLNADNYTELTDQTILQNRVSKNKATIRPFIPLGRR